MDTKPLVTVILVAYNHEDTIARCIESMLVQETDFPFIIDIAEDCSTDKTAAICADYAARYPDKIRLFPRTQNVGAEKNFRDALIRVQSPYWIETDGDDYWCDPQKLSLSVKALEENPDCTAVAHNVRQHNLMTGAEELLMGEKCNLYNGRTIDKSKVKYYFRDGFYFHISSRLCRNIINFADEKYSVSDLFMMYLFLDKGPIYYISRVMSVYNLSGRGSHTSLSDEQKRQDYLDHLKRMNAFFEYKYKDFFEPDIYVNRLPFAAYLYKLRKPLKGVIRLVKRTLQKLPRQGQ